MSQPDSRIALKTRNPTVMKCKRSLYGKGGGGDVDAVIGHARAPPQSCAF
jgi:hypothetical protein